MRRCRCVQVLHVHGRVRMHADVRMHVLVQRIVLRVHAVVPVAVPCPPLLPPLSSSPLTHMCMRLSAPGVVISPQAAHGWSALHLAAASGSPELMGMMLWRSYGAGAAAGAAGAGAAGAGAAAGEMVGADEGERRGTAAAAAAGGGSARRRGGGVAEEWRAMVAAVSGPAPGGTCIPWHACGSWVQSSNPPARIPTDLLASGMLRTPTVGCKQLTPPLPLVPVLLSLTMYA